MNLSDNNEIKLNSFIDKISKYKKMNIENYKYDRQMYLLAIIPLIIVSTFTGSANIIINYIPNEYQTTYILIIGLINIFASLVTAILEHIRSSKVIIEQRYFLAELDRLQTKSEFFLGKLDSELQISIEEIDKKFSDIKEFAPEIPEFIKKKYN